MKAHLIILACFLAEAYSKCPLRAPVGKLVNGCQVGNLTVTTYPSHEVINGGLCNSSADESYLNYQPQNVRFHQLRAYAAPAYLLTAVDVTSKKLLWIMSNLTLTSDLTIIPTTNRNPKEIFAYHKPELTQYSRQHEIEFLIFEERRDYPWRTYIQNNALYAIQFNLSSWIDSQQNSGITLCGPVAGGNVVAHLQLPPGPGPRPPYPTNPPPPPNSKHHPKSNANRIVVDGVLLAGFFVVLQVLAF